MFWDYCPGAQPFHTLGGGGGGGCGGCVLFVCLFLIGILRGMDSRTDRWIILE